MCHGIPRWSTPLHVPSNTPSLSSTLTCGATEARDAKVGTVVAYLENMLRPFEAAERAGHRQGQVTDETVPPLLDDFLAYENALKTLCGLLRGYAPVFTAQKTADKRVKGTTYTDDAMQGAIKMLGELSDVATSRVEIARADLFGRAPEPSEDMPLV